MIKNAAHHKEWYKITAGDNDRLSIIRIFNLCYLDGNKTNREIKQLSSKIDYREATISWMNILEIGMKSLRIKNDQLPATRLQNTH